MITDGFDVVERLASVVFCHRSPYALVERKSPKISLINGLKDVDFC